MNSTKRPTTMAEGVHGAAGRRPADPRPRRRAWTPLRFPATAANRPPSPRPACPTADRELLDFERQWWRHAGAKEQAIRDTFGLSATRYYQLLAQLIDRPEALEHDPMLVKRLRRLREDRRRRRTARRRGVRS